jgi:hypothetical protein
MRSNLCLLFACLALGCGARTASLDDTDFEGVPDGGGIDGSALHDVRLDSPTTPDVSTDVVPRKDTGPTTDAPKPDTAPVDTGSTATTGDLCKTDAECDKDGTGAHKCTIDLSPGYGNFDPSPVCVELGCDPGDGTSVVPCDADRGVCLNGGSTGICLPACTFDASGAPAKGCAGNDACNVYTLTSATEGIGYCFGGCTPAITCVGGNKCQVESGYCVEKPVKYTKGLGDACTDKDAMANRCNCLYPTTTNKGFCSAFCRVGTTKCDAGFVCTAFLSASFGKTPTDMGGWCAKPCTTDTDCTGLNSTCQDSSDGKVCLPFAI